MEKVATREPVLPEFEPELEPELELELEPEIVLVIVTGQYLPKLPNRTLADPDIVVIVRELINVM